jgi:hypothetical protein
VLHIYYSFFLFEIKSEQDELNSERKEMRNDIASATPIHGLALIHIPVLAVAASVNKHNEMNAMKEEMIQICTLLLKRYLATLSDWIFSMSSMILKPSTTVDMCYTYM